MFLKLHANLLYFDWANDDFLAFITGYYQLRFIDKPWEKILRKGKLPTVLLYMYNSILNSHCLSIWKRFNEIKLTSIKHLKNEYVWLSLQCTTLLRLFILWSNAHTPYSLGSTLQTDTVTVTIPKEQCSRKKSCM